MIPVRFAPLLYSAIPSGLMSLSAFAISSVRVLSIETGFVPAWLISWSVSGALALPTVAVVAPLTRRPVARLTAGPT